MAGQGLRAQRELFAQTVPVGRPPPEVRRALLAALEALLSEVAAAEAATGREGRDDQDHA